MGSLDSGLFPLKRDSLLRSSSGRSERHPFLQRPRSRIPRFLLFKKLDYLQWICTVAVFFFFVVIFQMFLPGSVVDKSESSLKHMEGLVSEDLVFFKEIMGGLEFAESIRFDPSKFLDKFRGESQEVNLHSNSSGAPRRFGYRKPQLALVFADMLLDPHQIAMVTVASALQDIGYAIQVYSLEEGPVQSVWENLGVSVTILRSSANGVAAVDWLNYEGILVNSLGAADILTCLVQEPFKSIPLIWTIHEKDLATRLRQYNSSEEFNIMNDWKKIFNRATVVVFPGYVLPIIYSAFDSGNFFVIPGSPAVAWEAETFLATDQDNLRVRMGYEPDDFVIVIVGSQFLYRGLWLEHALVLEALIPIVGEFSDEKVKIIILSGDSTNNYSVAVEAISLKLGYPRGNVKHFPVDVDVNILSITDLVIYGSFLEEQSFPDILLKAMCLGKLVISPDLSMIRKHINDKVNGFLFPKKNINALTQVLLQVISSKQLSPLALNVASVGKRTAKNLKAWETVENYILLLDILLKFPSEVASPNASAEINHKLRKEWQWHLFNKIPDPNFNRTLRSLTLLDKVEQQWSHSIRKKAGNITSLEDTFIYSIWEEEKYISMANAKRRMEEEQLKDRTDQQRGSWEEVYKSAKRVDRLRNELHERDERELERTGQPLCIYEAYFGQGVWPFLRHTSLYRGIGMLTRGRRPGTDDIDAPSRLPILNKPYYRDILGDYGAFFAIANRVDRVHKNPWIGFQSWRASARKVSLSHIAEMALVNSIEARKHGDTLYFWVRLDMDPRNPLQQDFWTFCDTINAGNCRFAFTEALKKTYGIKRDWNSLPPMPVDGSTWSVMNSWVLPTRSFLEFVMFSRMFVDSLDAKFYDEHHQRGHCILSLSRDKHCYSRVLELLVNVWAYHSARRMFYVNPETGSMHEHHKLSSRRGQMWIKWFSYATIKSMDEDLAEEADSNHSTRLWLWKSTGEVFWQGTFEKERDLKQKAREQRQKDRKDKLKRHGGQRRQRAIGKYVKPPPEETQTSNSTLVLPLGQTNLNSTLVKTDSR